MCAKITFEALRLWIGAVTVYTGCSGQYQCCVLFLHWLLYAHGLSENDTFKPFSTHTVEPMQIIYLEFRRQSTETRSNFSSQWKKMTQNFWNESICIGFNFRKFARIHIFFWKLKMFEKNKSRAFENKQKYARPVHVATKSQQKWREWLRYAHTHTFYECEMKHVVCRLSSTHRVQAKKTHVTESYLLLKILLLCFSRLEDRLMLHIHVVSRLRVKESRLKTHNGDVTSHCFLCLQIEKMNESWQRLNNPMIIEIFVL